MPKFPCPVVILGARSDIGRAIARCYAERGCTIILAARQAERLEADCADLQTRYGVKVSAVEFDVNASDPDRFFERLGDIPGTVVMVAGLLGDQARAELDDAEAALIMATNYAGPARFLLAAARRMRERREGCIIGVSSVAGDRGRKSNFVYGSAKAGFTAFLSGLRGSLLGSGIHVITVKPGFVATRMTAGLNLPRRLTATPVQVAQAVLKAHGRRSNVVYVSAVWRPIMQVIRILPESIFKRLSM